MTMGIGMKRIVRIMLICSMVPSMVAIPKTVQAASYDTLICQEETQAPKQEKPEPVVLQIHQAYKENKIALKPNKAHSIFDLVHGNNAETGATEEPKETTAETTSESSPGETDIPIAADEDITTDSVFNLTRSEMNKMSISQKAELVGLTYDEFKLFTKLVNREAGVKMQDKIMVAAVVWNRKFCKDYPSKITKVIKQPGQFQLRGSKTTEVYGNHKDKKAQLAILLAYKGLGNKTLPHNVKHYNSISFYTKQPSRYKKYKHYNNYFRKDVKCKCKWCNG